MARKSTSDFIERTTVHEGEMTWEIPEDPATQKHFVGGEAKTTQEAVEMGRELFDAISAERVKIARVQENS